jgi:phasin family protein
MNSDVNEFLEEQGRGLAELAERFRKERLAAARRAAVESAARIRSLNGRVRKLAQSGVRLSAISQGTAQSLIELQSEIVTAALDEAADQLQRAVHTGSVLELARNQAEVLQAARERIVKDMARTVAILKGAAGDVRKVAMRTTAKPAASRKTAARKRAAARPVAAKAVAAKAVARKAKASPRAKARARRSRQR